MMNQIIRMLHRILLFGVLMGVCTFSIYGVAAENPGFVQSNPGYPPGLIPSGQVFSPVPMIENAVQMEISGNRDISDQNISFSIHPGDLASGEKPSLVGFLTGGNLRTPVNIYGKATPSEPYQYLITVLPDDQGIFLWEIPENYQKIIEFQVTST